MSAGALLSAAIARIESFQLAEGAPARCGNDFRENLEQVVSYLGEVKRLLEDRIYDVDFNKKVIRFAYDIEDAVERRALLDQAGKGGGVKCLFNCLTRGLQEELDLGRIKKRIDELKLLHPAPMVTTAAAESRTSLDVVENHPGEDDIVGLEKDMVTLMDKLCGRHLKSSITAIVGMAGVGKTVLARRLFDHPRVKERFDICSWARVSQESNIISVMRSILGDISIDVQSSSLFEESELMSKICKTMYGRRCLVILDDIWSPKIWDRLVHCFPDDGHASRVVITTRDEGVADSIKGDVVRVPFLTNPESNELLRRKLRLHHSDMNKNASLQSTVNTIVSVCQGLPSKIIQVADILKQTKMEDWDEVVHRRLLTNETGETSLLENIALSYDYLAPHLKPCFLYLGQFPLDQPIPMEKVCLMWMAEGLASSRNFAESYLRELAAKNLVSVKSVDWLSEQVLVSCQLQDMTRKLCILKGKAEGFFGIVDSKIASTITGRVAVYLNGYVKGSSISSYIHVGKDIRAILFFGDDDSALLSQRSTKFAELEHFEWTRVLDFDGIDFRVNNEVPVCKGTLLHLRYLSFGRCYLEEFPFYFWNLPFLETLDLRVRTKMIIANVLWKMSNLKYLYFPVAYECKTQEKLKLDGARKLEVIVNFHAGICDVDDLLQFQNLQILKVISDGENTELKKLISNVQKISESLSLIKSSLVLKDFDCYSSERQDTFKELLKCGGIQYLYLEGCISKMPENLKIAQNFTDIVFDGTEFRKDPMSMLGELENLKSLVLCNDAIRVKQISCCEDSFPRLESLVINSLQSLELWVMEYGSMPRLTVLTIKHCHKLETFPEDLMEKPTLQHVKIGSMPQEFKEKVDNLVELQRYFDNYDLSVDYESL